MGFVMENLYGSIRNARVRICFTCLCDTPSYIAVKLFGTEDRELFLSLFFRERFAASDSYPISSSAPLDLRQHGIKPMNFIPAASSSNAIEKELEGYFDRLWPICRSITGPGYRESLAILQEIVPFEKLSFTTGTSVFDW